MELFQNLRIRVKGRGGGGGGGKREEGERGRKVIGDSPHITISLHTPSFLV